MPQPFNDARLRESVKNYRERLDVEKLLAIRLQHCMDLAFKLCQQIAGEIGPELIRCKESDGVVILVTQDRVLSFAPAGGVASDARLRRPQGSLCKQVLIFGHLEGDEASTLISSFRIYPNGTCTDGDKSWRLDDKDVEDFADYLIEVISRNLLDFQVFWPPTDEFPDFIKKISIQEDKPEPVQLKKACVGFDCPLPSITN